MMNSRMRSTVIKYHKGKVEIESMDDELPITIYIVAYCTSPNFYSNLEYIESFVKCKGDLDNEEKIMQTIRVSFLTKFKLLESFNFPGGSRLHI
jgi:hypothetical protein